MSALIVIEVVAADPVEAGEVLAEQVRAEMIRRWDNSDNTCERILAWLTQPSAKSVEQL